MTMTVWGRAAAYVGLSVALAGAAAQWAAPALMERVASAAVSSWLGEGHYRVRLEAAPRFRLLFGQFDRVEVVGTDLAAAGAVARLVVVLEDVRVDPWSLLLDRSLDPSRTGRAAFRVELEEHDVAHHLRAGIPFDDVTVSLRDGGFHLDGRLPVGRGVSRVEITGGFEIAGSASQQVKLAVDRLRVNGTEVPPFLVEQLLPLILQPGLVVDLGNLFPVPLAITGVDAREGLLIIEGEAEL